MLHEYLGIPPNKARICPTRTCARPIAGTSTHRPISKAMFHDEFCAAPTLRAASAMSGETEGGEAEALRREGHSDISTPRAVSDLKFRISFSYGCESPLLSTPPFIFGGYGRVYWRTLLLAIRLPISGIHQQDTAGVSGLIFEDCFPYYRLG